MPLPLLFVQHDLRWEKPQAGGLVIAPCDADETKAAYFAKTPV